MKARKAKTMRERLQAATLSTDDDVGFDKATGRIAVTGRLPSGERIYLGDFEPELMHQIDIPAREVLDRIRFGVHLPTTQIGD